MPSIPLIVVWFSVLAGYLPYTMGYLFLNPLILIGYGLLGFLIAANVSSVRIAMAASLGTTALAILVTNVTAPEFHLVLPTLQILLASASLSISSVLAADGLRRWGLRRGWPEEQVRGRLRLAFAIATALYYLNGYLPYESKLWLAAHTTSDALTVFALGTTTVFVGTWRLTR